MNETLARYGLNLQLVQLCFDQAEQALQKGEVPVGCVFVWLKADGHREVIAKSHNRTNELRNAVKHAEMNCVEQIVAKFKNCHMDILKNTIVLVTLEPCIMCCRMLRMLQVKAVIFAASNDRFGQHLIKVNSDERIKDPSLECISALDTDRAISLLQMFYEQSNPNVTQ